MAYRHVKVQVAINEQEVFSKELTSIVENSSGNRFVITDVEDDVLTLISGSNKVCKFKISEFIIFYHVVIFNPKSMDIIGEGKDLTRNFMSAICRREIDDGDDALVRWLTKDNDYKRSLFDKNKISVYKYDPNHVSNKKKNVRNNSNGKKPAEEKERESK